MCETSRVPVCGVEVGLEVRGDPPLRLISLRRGLKPSAHLQLEMEGGVRESSTGWGQRVLHRVGSEGNPTYCWLVLEAYLYVGEDLVWLSGDGIKEHTAAGSRDGTLSSVSAV